MADSPKAFAIKAKKDVAVHVGDSSEDETFDVTVRKDGQEVEKHEGVTAETVGTLKSNHFEVDYVDPPTFEGEAEE